MRGTGHGVKRDGRSGETGKEVGGQKSEIRGQQAAAVGGWRSASLEVGGK
jgi:hypothetical protein